MSAKKKPDLGLLRPLTLSLTNIIYILRCTCYEPLVLKHKSDASLGFPLGDEHHFHTNMSLTSTTSIAANRPSPIGYAKHTCMHSRNENGSHNLHHTNRTQPTSCENEKFVTRKVVQAGSNHRRDGAIMSRKCIRSLCA